MLGYSLLLLLSLTTPGPQSVQALPAQSIPLSGQLSLESCESIDPLAVDMAAEMKEGQPYECTLPGKRTVHARAVRESLANPSYQVLSGAEVTKEFVPDPQTRFHFKNFGPGAKLACDGALDRFYVGQGVLGYISAYNTDGSLLWTRQLPDFVGLESVVSQSEPDLQAVWDAFTTKASQILQVRSLGNYIVVETNTGGVGTNHFVYHRSGLLVGRIGPWDGFLIGNSSNQMEFACGGGPLDAKYAAKHRVVVRVIPGVPESQVLHALAWLMPYPVDRQLRFNCMGRLSSDLKMWLGEEYREEDAEAAKKLVLQAGGPDWFAELLKRPALKRVVASFNPISPDWTQSYRKALLEAGADADIAKGIKEDSSVKREPLSCAGRKQQPR